MDMWGHAASLWSLLFPRVTIVTLLTMVLMQVVEKEVCDQQYASRYLYGNRRITQNNILCVGSEGQDSCSVSPSCLHPAFSLG